MLAPFASAHPQPLAPLPEAEISMEGGLDRGLDHGGLGGLSSSSPLWGSATRPAATHSPSSRGTGGGGSQEPSPFASEWHSAQASLVRQAQLAFRTRQARKKAVRVIESAWSEWQYHSEQANLAASDAESAHFHAYHAMRRERAARVIQGYLQRQQGEEGEAGSDGLLGGMEPAGTLHEGGPGARPVGGATDRPLLYSSAELEMLRRVQRAFRAHVRSQAEEAEEALKEARLASHRAAALDGSGSGDVYERLCGILRKVADDGTNAAANLSREEQAVLATLQQAVRDNLERKRKKARASGMGGPPPRRDSSTTLSATTGTPLPTVPSELEMDAMIDEAESGL